jgi:uncharacterized membrane protein YtjA (UPF0391 family)
LILKCRIPQSVISDPRPTGQKGGMDMLRWALIFFVVALLAAVLGFTGIAVAAAGVAKVFFFLFVILFLITLLGHVARRP